MQNVLAYRTQYISFECAVNETNKCCTLHFNAEHAILISNIIYQFHSNLNIFTGVRTWTDRQTSDRQNKLINTLNYVYKL